MQGQQNNLLVCMIVLFVIPPTMSHSERRIIEFERGKFNDMIHRNKLQNMGYEFLFKIVDDFYVFATNKSWSAEEIESVKHILDGKIKHIYQDSNIFSAAGIDVGATAGDEYDSPGTRRPTFCQCPPYFDLAQEVDRSWAEGYTGRHVVIAVTDVGVDIDSPNLRPNIASHLSFNFVDNNTNLRPEIFPDYPESLHLTNHGTACSGLIAGIKENDNCSLCGAGVAFNSKVAALKIGQVKKFHWEYNPEISRGLYSAALGYKNQQIHIYSNSWTFDEPFKTLDPFTESAFADGLEKLTVAHTNRGSASRKCDNKFGGSSAATAVVSGMIALALEANPSLSLRDIKHLLVESAGYIGLAATSNFTKNCAGKHFHKVHTPADTGYELDSTSNLTCQQQPFCIDKIEHIIVKLSFVYPKHTQTILSLISPCGTESILMEHAGEPPKDENDVGKTEGVSVHATFLSNHFWGEKMEGNWTVKIIGLGSYS
ncbi:FURIN-like protein, partial [Mya arenaria]